MRILITSLGSTAAQGLAWALRVDSRRTWHVIGADLREEPPGLDLVDRVERIPAGADSSYPDAIAALVARHSVRIVVPVMEPELASLAAEHARLAGLGAILLAPGPAAVEAAGSKRLLHRTLTGLGLTAPPVSPAGTLPRFPAFVRPDRGTGSRGALRVDDADQLEEALRGRTDLVVTPWVDGTPYSIDGFAFPEGRLVHAIRRRRDEVRGGLVVRSEVVPLHPYRERVEHLCQGLSIRGFFNLQVIEDRRGDAWFHDLNPRLGGGMALSFSAGLDAPGYLEAISRGEEPPAGGSEAVGTRLVRRWHNTVLAPRTVSPG
ncbi:MAG: ATP-grasp domain-containing protein [Holophagales bacterium]|jgi:carbamoyl-phosphate synthase large subunit|nr:ATP-grasp domain-containing protein [Holophagales bacterium]